MGRFRPKIKVGFVELTTEVRGNVYGYLPNCGTSISFTYMLRFWTSGHSRP